MTYALVAVGVSAAVGLYSSSQSASAGAKAASKQGQAENAAIAKHNMSQMVRNSYRTGMMNMQLGLQKRQAVQQGFDLTAQAQHALGAATANQAASGTVGASADAVTNDIQMKLGEAQAQQRDDYEMMLTNYNNDLEAMRMNALNDVVDAKEYKYSGPSRGQMIGSALLGATAQFASGYATKQMSLGLGPKPPVQSNSVSFTSGQLGSGTFGMWGKP